ncbi:ABC transporter ATP-binding protein [Castellaniella sp. GW247-6E4]|uniref:ABC transporter ATP-binding protein n=1 Tax=Castellaniella sp. GW247-6E4 TaxID=3140380 RepID=UPI003314D35E
MTKLLDIQGMCVAYGPIEAVRGIDLEIAPGEVVALVGSNGAGKSTTLKAIMGLQQPSAGQILFDDKQIDALSTAEIVARGITLSPEGRRVFPKMSTHENLLAGAFLQRDKSDSQQTIDGVYARFPRLYERRTQLAGSLSGGEQQMLAIGRALMAKPRLLLLDEPTLGLAPLMVKEIARTIDSIRAEGVSILLVEQNANMALRACNRAVVMENGSIAMSGTGQELLHDEHIRKLYLGL